LDGNFQLSAQARGAVGVTFIAVFCGIAMLVNPQCLLGYGVPTPPDFVKSWKIYCEIYPHSLELDFQALKTLYTSLELSLMPNLIPIKSQ
jgi:hypothetical protein